jgi:hypothetical protein
MNKRRLQAEVVHRPAQIYCVAKAGTGGWVVWGMQEDTWFTEAPFVAAWSYAADLAGRVGRAVVVAVNEAGEIVAEEFFLSPQP